MKGLLSFFFTSVYLQHFIIEISKGTRKRREAANKIVNFINRFCKIYFARLSKNLRGML